MPFTTVAYTESQDSATLTEITAAADAHVTVSGDDIYVPQWNHLAGYSFMGANFTQGRILSPSLRAQLNIDVEPADLADEPASNGAFHDLFESPIPLEINEALTTQMAEDAAGASRVTAILFLSDGVITQVSGKIYTVRATNGSTLTANAWTNGALTFAQTLPSGMYQVVGMRAQSAGLRAARLFLTGYGHRAGCLGYDADGDIENPRFRYGKAGVWGEFHSRSPPTVDFLSASADSAQVVHLDLIPL